MRMGNGNEAEGIPNKTPLVTQVHRRRVDATLKSYEKYRVVSFLTIMYRFAWTESPFMEYELAPYAEPSHFFWSPEFTDVLPA